MRSSSTVPGSTLTTVTHAIGMLLHHRVGILRAFATRVRWHVRIQFSLPLPCLHRRHSCLTGPLLASQGLGYNFLGRMWRLLVPSCTQTSGRFIQFPVVPVVPENLWFWTTATPSPRVVTTVPRAAGDSSTYELAVLNGAGAPVGRSIHLPSVTTILKALPKGGLEWWGYKLGIEATIAKAVSGEDVAKMTVDSLYEILKREKLLTPHSVMTSAGSRGADVHDICEFLLTEGTMPSKADIGVDRLGYAEALWEWAKALPLDAYEAVAVEVPIISLDHRYAGTVDAILYSPTIDMYSVIDFKTSKAIYESHLLQSTAYMHAAIEQAYIPVNAAMTAGVVRLANDGTWEYQQSHHTIEDFLKVKSVWEWLESQR